MLVNAETAESAFEELPPACKVPTLKPSYVVADSARDPALLPRFFVCREDGNVYYHAFHVSAIPATDWHDIQSPYGLGGPILSSVSRAFTRSALEKYESWCRENRILVEFVRFHPLLSCWREYPGDVIEDRETVAVDLKQAPGSEFRKLTKRNIATAVANGLTVAKWSGPEWMAVFRPLYEELMQQLGADRFYRFPTSYFEALSRLPDAVYFTCGNERRFMAAALFLSSGDIAEYYLGASSKDGKKAGAMSLLMREAIAHFHSRGMQWLHLGGGTDGRPENPLLFYKRGFSKHQAVFRIGQRIYQPELYAGLRETWEKKNGRKADRILFYRF